MQFVIENHFPFYEESEVKTFASLVEAQDYANNRGGKAYAYPYEGEARFCWLVFSDGSRDAWGGVDIVDAAASAILDGQYAGLKLVGVEF